MPMIKCPECNQEILDENSNCPNCGYPLKEEKKNVNSDGKNEGVIVCSECGNNNLAGSLFCENCGCPLNRDYTQKATKFNLKYVGIAMCIVACILFIVSYNKISCKEYKFYLNHYEECMDGYNENSSQQSGGGLISDTYDYIADEYKEMAEDDMKKIKEYRIWAIVCASLGIALLAGGLVVIKKGR